MRLQKVKVKQMIAFIGACIGAIALAWVYCVHVNAAPSSSDNREQRQKKPYTIMIYMNGSDLESESGAATNDLIEILESGLDSRNAYVVLFTGGANRWQNSVVPANECVIWEAEDGWLYEVTGMGLLNMGNPQTLSDFIQFGMQNYPADKYGLIMWDHGGGAIAGYGQDEKFLDGNLTLPDMRNAFEDAGLGAHKLEFLGFDSCLMATVEMAVVASDYARYLIASEDLEPGDGWDYSFLQVLNENPQIKGDTVGRAVVDTFFNYYGSYSDEILSLSVSDLDFAGRVMDAMGNLMQKCSDSLSVQRMNSFRTLAGRRGRTKTFGEGTPRDNECDMVDIGDMARQLSDLYPAESEQVFAELDRCVLYNRHNSDTDLQGLSAYYIYGGKAVGRPALDTYASLKMDETYTGYLQDFFDLLVSNGTTRSTSSAMEEPIRSEITRWQPVGGQEGCYLMTGIQEGDNIHESGLLWPYLNGMPVCLYEANRTAQNVLYAIPACVNGQDCAIVVSFNERHPEGRVMGKRNNEGIIVQKGYDPINAGDELCFYYQAKIFEGHTIEDAGWQAGTILPVDGELALTWLEANPGQDHYSLRQTDIRNNWHFSGLEKPQKSKSA